MVFIERVPNSEARLYEVRFWIYYGRKSKEYNEPLVCEKLGKVDLRKHTTESSSAELLMDEERAPPRLSNRQERATSLLATRPRLNHGRHNVYNSIFASCHPIEM